MKTSKVLKLAKQWLASNTDQIYDTYDKQEYICISIGAACRAACDDAAHRAGIRAREIIQQRLGKYYTFDAWLHIEHGIHIGDCKTEESRQQFMDKVQATRHAWVDSMIKEFAAKGD